MQSFFLLLDKSGRKRKVRFEDEDIDEDEEPLTMQKRLLKLAGHDPVSNLFTMCDIINLRSKKFFYVTPVQFLNLKSYIKMKESIL